MQAKYKTVADDIEKQVLSGLFSDTRKLPTEDELIEIYAVSRNTIRNAIDVLVRKGIIIPIQGSGMFLRSLFSDDCVNLENFLGLTKAFPNKKIGTKVLEFKEIEADEKLAYIMQCDVGTPIHYIERLRLVDNVPYVIEYSYYNKLLIPYLNMEILRGSIYAFITSDPKKQLGYVDRVIRADVLNAHDAEILGLKAGDPTLISENRAMLKSGVIFDYSIDIHNYKNTKFLKLSNFT